MIQISHWLIRICGMAIMLIVIGLTAIAQDINKEVYVVRPYEPTLSDASKYSFMPSPANLETSIPAFSYSITPKKLQNSFEPEPIKAAKTVTTSLPKIYNSWIKLGMGNYSTPLAEFNLSNLRSKDYSYGIYARHQSSHSKLRLENNDNVNAGFVENNMNLYGKRFFSGSTLYGNLRFDQYAFNYYGYNVANFSDYPEIRYDSLRQRVYNPGIDAGIRSVFKNNDQLNFDITLSYDYFTDKLKNRESSVVLQSRFSKNFTGLTGGLDLSVDYSNLKGEIDTTDNTIVRFNPWIGKSSADWQFKAGFETAVDVADISRYYFYPKANLDIIMVKDILIPFVGVSGELKKNSYKNLFSENQFIVPGLSLKNTSSNFIVFGGLKGNISSVVRFRADASLTLFKNHHFFINDTVRGDPEMKLENQFTAAYDNVNLITYHGQLAISPSDRFELTLDGKIFNYKMVELEKPWHMPDFTIDMDGVYRVKKFELEAGISIIGNRWVKTVDGTDGMRKLSPVYDANFGISYHYSKLLTVFADFYNLTEQGYQLWNQYPAQRFNFMFGFSYKL